MARLGRAFPNQAIIRRPLKTANTPTNVTLGQAAWAWAGGAPGVDAKTQLTLGQAVWAWTGNAPRVDAKTGITLGQAAWLWTGRPMPNFGLSSAVQSVLSLMGCGH